MQHSLLSSLNLVKMDKLFNQDFSKPPDLKTGTNIPQTLFNRSSGNYKNVPKELEYMAEEALIMKSHKEFPCKLPDVPRSTFLMVFSPDGTKVASTHGNHNVYVTELTSKRNVRTLSGHPRTPWCIAFHPSSNQILASGCLGGQVRVWDLHGGSEIWMTESQTVIASLAFHPTDRLLVIASYNEVLFWDWSCPAPFAKSTTVNEKEKVRFVGFDPLGHKLLTGVANAPLRIESQWNRTPLPPAPQPPPPAPPDEPFQNDYERRIIVCYRFMVQQYEQLVHRYRLLIRARSGNSSSIAGSSSSVFGGDTPSLRRRTPPTPGGARTIRRFRSNHPLPTRLTQFQLARLRPAVLRLSERRVPGSLFSSRGNRGVVSNPVAPSSSRESRSGDGTMLQQFESEITESLARLHRNIRRMRIHMPWESEHRDSRSTTMNNPIDVDTSDSDVDIETLGGASPPSPHSARITVVPNPSGAHSWRQRDPFSYTPGRNTSALGERIRNRMHQSELRRIYMRASRFPVFGPQRNRNPPTLTRPLGTRNTETPAPPTDYESLQSLLSDLNSENPFRVAGRELWRTRQNGDVTGYRAQGDEQSTSGADRSREDTTNTETGDSAVTLESLLANIGSASSTGGNAGSMTPSESEVSLNHVNQSEDSESSRSAVVSVMGVAARSVSPHYASYPVSRLVDLADYLATTEDVLEPTGPFLRATTYSIRQFFGNMQATYNVIASGRVTSHSIERLNFLYEHYATNRSFQSIIQLARHLYHASIMCRARFLVVKAAHLDRRWTDILQQLTRYSAFHVSPSNTSRSEATAEFFSDLDRNGRLLEVCFGALAEGSSQEYERNIFDAASEVSGYEDAARRLQSVLLRHLRWTSRRLDAWTSPSLPQLGEIAELDSALRRELLALDVMSPELTQTSVRAVRDEFVDTLIQDLTPPIFEDTLLTCIRRFSSLSSRMDDIITQELSSLSALPDTNSPLPGPSSAGASAAMFSEDESSETEVNPYDDMEGSVNTTGEFDAITSRTVRDDVETLGEYERPSRRNRSSRGGNVSRSNRSIGDSDTRGNRSLAGDDTRGNRSLGDNTRGNRSLGDDTSGNRSYRGEDTRGNRYFGGATTGSRSFGGDDSRGNKSLGDDSRGNRSLGDDSRGNRSLGDDTRRNGSLGGDNTKGNRSLGGGDTGGNRSLEGDDTRGNRSIEVDNTRSNRSIEGDESRNNRTSVRDEIDDRITGEDSNTSRSFAGDALARRNRKARDEYRANRSLAEDVIARNNRITRDVSSASRTSVGDETTSNGCNGSTRNSRTIQDGSDWNNRTTGDGSARNCRTTGDGSARNCRTTEDGSGRNNRTTEDVLARNNRTTGDGSARNCRTTGDVGDSVHRKLLRRSRQQRLRPAYRVVASSSSEDETPVIEISDTDSDRPGTSSTSNLLRRLKTLARTTSPDATSHRRPVDPNAPSTSTAQTPVSSESSLSDSDSDRPGSSSTSDLLKRLKALARTTSSESTPNRGPVDPNAPSTSTAQTAVSSESSSFSNIMQSVREFITQLETLVGPGRNSLSRASDIFPSSSSSTPSSSSTSSLNTSATSTPEDPSVPGNPPASYSPLSAFMSGIRRKRKQPPPSDAAEPSARRRRRHLETEPSHQDHTEAFSSSQPDECSCWFRAAVDNSPPTASGSNQSPSTSACPLDKSRKSHQSSCSVDKSKQGASVDLPSNQSKPGGRGDSGLSQGGRSPRPAKSERKLSTQQSSNSAVTHLTSCSKQSSQLPNPPSSSQASSSSIPSAVSQELPSHMSTTDSLDEEIIQPTTSTSPLDRDMTSLPTTDDALLNTEGLFTQVLANFEQMLDSDIDPQVRETLQVESPSETQHPSEYSSSLLEETPLRVPEVTLTPLRFPPTPPPPQATPTPSQAPSTWESVRFLRVPRARPWESCSFSSPNSRIPSPSRIVDVEMLRVPSLSPWSSNNTMRDYSNSARSSRSAERGNNVSGGGYGRNIFNEESASRNNTGESSGRNNTSAPNGTTPTGGGGIYLLCGLPELSGVSASTRDVDRSRTRERDRDRSRSRDDRSRQRYDLSPQDTEISHSAAPGSTDATSTTAHTEEVGNSRNTNSPARRERAASQTSAETRLRRLIMSYRKNSNVASSQPSDTTQRNDTNLRSDATPSVDSTSRTDSCPSSWDYSHRLSDNPRFRSGDFRWPRSITPSPSTSHPSISSPDANISASIAEASRRIDDSLFRLRNSNRSSNTSSGTSNNNRNNTDGNRNSFLSRNRTNLLSRIHANRSSPLNSNRTSFLNRANRTHSPNRTRDVFDSGLNVFMNHKRMLVERRNCILRGRSGNAAPLVARENASTSVGEENTATSMEDGNAAASVTEGNAATSSVGDRNPTTSAFIKRELRNTMKQYRTMANTTRSTLFRAYSRGKTPWSPSTSSSSQQAPSTSNSRTQRDDPVESRRESWDDRPRQGPFTQQERDLREDRTRQGPSTAQARESRDDRARQGPFTPLARGSRDDRTRPGSADSRRMKLVNLATSRNSPGRRSVLTTADWARVGPDWRSSRAPPPPPPASTLPSTSRGSRSSRRRAANTGTSDPERTRMIKARSQARHILAMMLRHISSFFQNANLLDQQESFFFHERVYNLHRLLQLALHLTELLYAQLSLSRHLLDNLRSSLNSVTRLQSLLRHRQASSRLLQVPTFRPSRGSIRLTRESSVPISVLGQNVPGSSNAPGPGEVPQVHLNDLPLSSSPTLPPLPASPPTPTSPPSFRSARFLHPRHVTPPTPWDETGEERAGGLGSNVFLMRGAYGPNSILVPDSYYSPHHRIQAWDFARSNIPDIWNAQKNIVVKECKIHNDASVDISKDGQILVTLLPSGRLSVTTMLGVYSLHWSTLGQCLYTTSFELNAVSVSLSPTSRHLIVGLASRRVSLSSFADTHTIAQIFRLEGGVAGPSSGSTREGTEAGPGGKEPLPGGKKGRLVQLRHIELPRDTGYMSLNCIRWAPTPGQGLVYGTNTGLLRILE